MSFIPANESRFHITFFDYYTRWLLRRRFKQVWIHQKYMPGSQNRTVYFLNHNYWWDGLVPLYLNQTRLKQKARAMMEEKQILEYSFFRKIGAFSIDPDNPRSVVGSLRYAEKSMKRPNSSLYIYPEGSIKPVSELQPEFKEGLSWLAQNLMADGVHFVPVALYIHNLRNSKPELYIKIGVPAEIQPDQSREELTSVFEHEVHELLKETRKVAGFTDEFFMPEF